MSFQSIDEQLKTKQHLLDEIAEMGHTLAEDAQTEEDKFLIDGKVGLDVVRTLDVHEASAMIIEPKTNVFFLGLVVAHDTHSLERLAVVFAGEFLLQIAAVHQHGEFGFAF